MYITHLHARQVDHFELLLETLYIMITTQIYDSRGNPTVEVDLYTQNGAQ